MTKHNEGAGEGAWSKKVDPKRARAEAAQAKRQQDSESVFNELFGAPDAGLMAQMEESYNTLAAIGQDILRRNAAASQPQGEAE